MSDSISDPRIDAPGSDRKLKRKDYERELCAKRGTPADGCKAPQAWASAGRPLWRSSRRRGLDQSNVDNLRRDCRFYSNRGSRHVLEVWITRPPQISFVRRRRYRL